MSLVEVSPHIGLIHCERCGSEIDGILETIKRCGSYESVERKSRWRKEWVTLQERARKGKCDLEQYLREAKRIVGSEPRGSPDGSTDHLFLVCPKCECVNEFHFSLSSVHRPESFVGWSILKTLEIPQKWLSRLRLAEPLSHEEFIRVVDEINGDLRRRPT